MPYPSRPYIWGRRHLNKEGRPKLVQQRPGVIKFKFPYRTLYAADLSALQQYPPALWPSGQQPTNQYSARVFRQMTLAQFYQQRLLQRVGIGIITHWVDYYSGPLGWLRKTIHARHPAKRIRLALLV